MGWTAERVELLKKLWSDGLSASQIAAELGGVTRNAVIGKVHRLGLSGRAKPAGSSVPRARRPRAPGMPRSGRLLTSGANALKAYPSLAPRRVLPPLEDIVVPISLRASLLTLTDAMCKWPTGDPATEDFHFCGHKVREGSPYCEYHSRVAYQPVGDRRRERRAV
jgi:GcrA cell cycle regulator